MPNEDKQYKDITSSRDYEFDFYERFLLKCEGIENSNNLVEVSDEDTKCFMELTNLYMSSTDVAADERTDEEKLADSFTFYVSTGVIKLANSKYYIDIVRMSELTENYKNCVDDKGIALKKGTNK